MNIKECGLYLANNLSSTNLDLCWMIWQVVQTSRNNQLWKGKTDTPDNTVSRVLSWWQEFIRLSLPSSRSLKRTGSLVKWSERLNGKLKINVGSAWDEARKFGGIGIVIQDTRTEILWLLLLLGGNAFSPLFMEAIAAREGLALAARRGLQNLTLESHFSPDYCCFEGVLHQ